MTLVYVVSQVRGAREAESMNSSLSGTKKTEKPPREVQAKTYNLRDIIRRTQVYKGVNTGENFLFKYPKLI